MAKQQARPWSPIRIGVALAAGLTALFLATELGLGRFSGAARAEASDAWIAVVHCVLLGALVGAYGSTGRLARRSLEGLARSFPASRDVLLPYRGPPRWSRLVAAAIGAIAIGGVTPFLTAPFPWVPALWTPEVAWHRVLGPAIGALSGLTLYAVVRESLLVSRAAREVEGIDLFLPDQFGPLVTHGLANGLATVVLLSIAGLFLVDPGQLRAVGPILGVMLPGMVVAIVLPVWGARSRIREAKASEKRWALEGIREARREEPVDIRRLGDLSAYHRVVDGVTEWPFPQSAFVTAASYVLIPAAAWLGAVLLETLLQAVVVGA